MSREQWGHGYYKGYKDALKTTASFYDWLVVLYADEDSAKGDFARDVIGEATWPNKNNWRYKFCQKNIVITKKRTTKFTDTSLLVKRAMEPSRRLKNCGKNMDRIQNEFFQNRRSA